VETLEAEKARQEKPRSAKEARPAIFIYWWERLSRFFEAESFSKNLYDGLPNLTLRANPVVIVGDNAVEFRIFR
jgi:hypothetical protein